MKARLLVGAALVAAVLAGCGDDGGDRSAAPSTTPTASAAPVPFLTFPAAPYGIEAAGDVVWVENDANGTSSLLRVDARTAAVRGSVPGSAPYFDGHDLWYRSSRDLVRANPGTGAPVQRFRVGDVGPLAILPDAFWVAVGDESQGTMQRWDRRTKRVTDRVALPAGEVKHVVVAGGAVWVVVDGADVVLKVDPAARRVVARVPAGMRPHSAAVGFGALWVTDHGEQTLVRLDPAGARVVARVPDVAFNVGVTVTPTSVWTATIDGVAEVDPATNQVKRRVSLGTAGDYYDLAVAAGSLWITSPQEMRVYHLAL